MPDCCDPSAYRDLFNEKEADRRLADYRRHGLDDPAKALVAHLVERGVAGKSLLEIGGGIGDLQVELLKEGVARSVNVELSPGYETAASRLIEQEGLEGRVDRRIGDFVAKADEVEPADIVVLNRVICCYPWMERLVDAAASKTLGSLAVVLPRDRWLGNVFVAFANLGNRMRGSAFRAYVHPVDAVEAKLYAAGLQVEHAEPGVIWLGMVLGRV